MKTVTYTLRPPKLKRVYLIASIKTKEERNQQQLKTEERERERERSAEQ